jgi:DNA invertase Pin-like site-specific DNA recombinase
MNTSPSGKVRALIYTRLSKADLLPDGTPDPEAVERQERTCRRYCKAKGWTVAEVVTDNDLSASRYSRKARPGWARVIEVMKAAEVDVIVGTHLDRLTRRPREIEDLIDLVEATGVMVATTEGTMDLTTDDGRAMARVGSAFAAHYSDATSRRMRAQRSDRARRGDPVVTVDGFGWRQGLPVESEAEAIRNGARAVIGGGSLASIARDWNAQGLPRRRTTAPWRSQDVRVVLLNPRHAGRAVYKGEVVADIDGPTILDRDTADALAAVLNDPARKRGARRKRALSGVLRCGLCGTTMRRMTFSTTGKGAWSCPTNTGGCGRIAVTAGPVDEAVQDAVLTALDTGLPTSAPVLDPTAAAALRELDAEAAELGKAYGAGDVPLAAFLAASKALEDRRQGLVAALTPARTAAALAPYRKPGSLRKAWPTLDESQRNAIVRAVLDAVVIGPGEHKRRDPAERIIEWRWSA